MSGKHIYTIGLVCLLTLSNYALAIQFETMSGYASNPQPVSGAVGLRMPLQLSWTPGDWSSNVHRVFFGTSYEQVAAADTASLPTYRGTVAIPVYPLSKLLEDLNGDSQPDYVLADDTNYYWRIDEVNTIIPQTWVGPVWNFNTANYCLIEDFQDYDTTEELNDIWLEQQVVCPSSRKGSGRVALVREGLSGRYMQFSYNKWTGDEGVPWRYFSEVDYQYGGSGANWTTGGVYSNPPKLLELRYRGFLTNSADPVYDRMYIAIEDTDGDVSITLHPDPNAQRSGSWVQWDMSFSDLNNQNPVTKIASVNDLYIGFGSRCNQVLGGGEGNVMFDDIKLFAKTCNPLFGPAADLDNNCVVNIRDLDVLANDWLAKDEDYNWVSTQVAPAAPILWYKFNETSGEDVADSGTGDANNYTGFVLNYNSALTWDTDGGRDGTGCIYLPPGQNTYVEIIIGVRNPLYFQGTTGGMSFSIWEDADMTESWGWSGIFGTWNATEESLEIHCPSPWPPANPYGPCCDLIKRNVPGSGDDVTVSTGKMAESDFGGRWNNWIFIKNDSSSPQEILIYLNGILVANANTNDDADIAGPMMLPPINHFRVGTRGGNWGGWMGRLDDFKVWNYALSENEVHYIATDGTGLRHVELDSVANIKHSTPEIVNFGDLAMMVDEWLTTKLWPP